MVGYYRRSVPNFSAIAVPLSDPTKKNESNVVRWSDGFEGAFQALKVRLSQQPVLRLPDLEENFVLRTVASNVGIATVLLQGDEDLQPVSYASKKLSDAETKYPQSRTSVLRLCGLSRSFRHGYTGNRSSCRRINSRCSTSHVGEREADALRFVAPTVPVSAAGDSWHKNLGADYPCRAE